MIGYYTYRQGADLLGIYYESLKRIINKHGIKKKMIGNTVYVSKYSLAQVERLIGRAYPKHSIKNFDVIELHIQKHKTRLISEVLGIPFELTQNIIGQFKREQTVTVESKMNALIYRC